jgi:hypothetical protein
MAAFPVYNINPGPVRFAQVSAKLSVVCQQTFWTPDTAFRPLQLSWFFFVKYGISKTFEYL